MNSRHQLNISDTAEQDWRIELKIIRERMWRMNDFDTHTDEIDDSDLSEERSDVRERLKGFLRATARRFVMFLSFGPGVIGFLWLIGRILRR